MDPGLLEVEDLAAGGEDRLAPRIAATLGGATGRIALDDEDLTLLRIGRLAIRKLARQAAAAQQPFTVTSRVARLPGGDTRDGSRLTLADDHLPLAGVLLEPIAQLGVDHLQDKGPRLGVAELGLGLALELWFSELHREDRCEPFPNVVPGQPVLWLLDQSPVLAPLVGGIGERCTEAFLMGPALMGVDRVGKGVHRLGVG